ncbi:MAG: MMPL family transporter, partial [Thermodesulfobacteriota bacterium]|nr:MMPL family transporter [Thermodesulfobacteriota bacterium]
MEKRIARLIIDRRGTILLIVGLITLFFLYKASQTEMVTAFKDLLPQNHPYIKLHREFQDTFGGANTISIAVESKKGDIFNIDTLTKVKEMNDLIELTRGVNNYQIHSIARHNVKDIRATSWGIEADPVMHPYVPETREEIEKLKKVIYGNETIYGKLVSRDSKAALILAEFLEERLDYKYLFKRIMEAKNSLEDDNTTIYIAGEPILYGWIYHYFREIVYVMVATTLVMILMLWIYLKRIEGVIIPMTSALLTAIWGLGITRLLGFNFDPLTLVIPFVIAARTLSHSVQMAERF